MKLLFDENLSVRLVSRLSSVYPDSQHVGLVGLQGKADREIWAFAAAHGYAVVSKDNDFRQLSFLQPDDRGISHFLEPLRESVPWGRIQRTAWLRAVSASSEMAR